MMQMVPNTSDLMC